MSNTRNIPLLSMTYKAFLKYLPGEGLSSRKLLFTKGFIVKNSTELTDSGIGQLQKSRISAADKRPVFGLFIAEKINPEVISHLYFVASRSSQYYEGKVRILPIERRNFIRLTESALKHPNFNSKVLLSFFENMFDKFHFSLEAGELNWFDHIQQKAADIHLNP